MTLLDDGLFVTADLVLLFCTLYEGDIQNYNITAPRDPKIFIAEFLTTTEPLATIELLITAETLTSESSLTIAQTHGI